MPYQCLQDTLWYQAGFIFPCCKVGGDEEGCKSTKHRADANEHIRARFDDEEEKESVAWAECANCGKGFDENAEDPEEDCVFHPGTKTVDWDGDFWADHDEDCHGRIDDLIDDPDMEGGFMWDCCEGELASEGCTEMEHSTDVYYP